MKMSTPRMLLLPIAAPLQIIFVGMKLIGMAGDWLDTRMMKFVQRVEHNAGWVNTLDKGWVQMSDGEYRAKFKRSREKW